MGFIEKSYYVHSGMHLKIVEKNVSARTVFFGDGGGGGWESGRKFWTCLQKSYFLFPKAFVDLECFVKSLKQIIYYLYMFFDPLL